MKKLHRILLVDDDKATNFLHRLLLDEMNLAEGIDVAINGKEALDHLESCALIDLPNLVFLDINMPLMNGFEFLKNYTKLDKEIKKNVKVVMLSSSVDQGDIAKAKQFKEVNDFIGKPLTEEIIITNNF